MPVLLVRHVVAVSRRSWTEDDASRPLDERGRRQAAALVDALAGYDIVRVQSSPAARCMATVEPVATAGGLFVEPEDDLYEGHGHRATSLVRSLLAAEAATATPAGPTMVLCSHGDVLPEVLAELEDDGADLGDKRRCQKGSTWVLERRVDGGLVGRYVPPPA